MEAIYNYITENAITFISFIFWLWVAWSTLKWEIKELRQRLEKIEDLDLDSRLTRMEANLDWIRTTLEKLDNLHK